MTILLLLLFALVALVATCPPPLNDMYYLGNDTHTTADLVRDLDTQYPPGTAWTEVVSKTGAPLSTWPDGKIAYCFAQPRYRVMYQESLTEAWNLWDLKLGDPSKANGHKLEFEEFNFPEDSKGSYCYNKLVNPTDPAVWNPVVPASTLVITQYNRVVPGVTASATTGYIPDTWPSHLKEGRHVIAFNPGERAKYPNDKMWYAAIAHEMGHTFGLWHEHQRPDRDHYVRFNCNGLPSYADAEKQVNAEGKYNMGDVCKDGLLAARYGFGIVGAYDTINHQDPAGQVDGRFWFWQQNYPARQYDDKSLMHYPSTPKNWDNDDEKMTVPLVFWKQRGPDYNPPTDVNKDLLDWCKIQIAPTSQDIEGVKRLYPWTG